MTDESMDDEGLVSSASPKRRGHRFTGAINRQVFAAVSRLRERGYTVKHKSNPNGYGNVWSINGGEWLEDAQVWAFLDQVANPGLSTAEICRPIRITLEELEGERP